MTDLSEQARAILEAGRALDNPSGAARERARRAVMARIAAAGAVTALSTGATAAAVPAVKLVVPVILVLAGGVGGGLLWRAGHRAPSNHASVVAASVRTAPPVVARPESPAAEAAAAVPAPAPEPLAPLPRAQPWRRTKTRAAVASVHVAAAAPPGDGLQDETALLARVNAALRSGDTGLGLVLLDEYDQRFPSGVLREESTATRIIARCQTGDDGAHDAARRFVEQHPRSPLSSRVRSSCLTKPVR